MGRCIFFRRVRETDAVQRSLRDQAQIIDNQWTAHSDRQSLPALLEVPSVETNTVDWSKVPCTCGVLKNRVSCVLIALSV